MKISPQRRVRTVRVLLQNVAESLKGTFFAETFWISRFIIYLYKNFQPQRTGLAQCPKNDGIIATYNQWTLPPVFVKVWCKIIENKWLSNHFFYYFHRKSVSHMLAVLLEELSIEVKQLQIMMEMGQKRDARKTRRYGTFFIANLVESLTKFNSMNFIISKYWPKGNQIVSEKLR